MDYDEMLDRAIDDTPEIEDTGERFEVPAPDIRQEGNATVFENFQAVCDRLSREAEHVMKFLQTELGTSGHIDERGRARLTGEFRTERIADAIDAYTEGFVICPECGLPDTKLVTHRGADMLRCDARGAPPSTQA